MKILQVHNYYQYPGGEDIVVKNEYDLLTSKKNKVIQYIKNNSEIDKYALIKKIKLFFDATYSKNTYKEIINLLKIEKPDVVHVHNTLPLISPSVYYACKDLNVPVVQTLHNYRLFCSNAYFFREGHICEECVGKSLFHSVKYGCYKNSRLQTFALARIVEQNKKWGTWENKIDLYIALTEFSKKKLIEAGMPENKIVVKPNFIFNDPGIDYETQNHFLCAGRLDITKGTQVLLEAKKKLKNKVNILVAGDGILRDEIKKDFNENYLGQLNHCDLMKFMKGSIALIFPSILYENLPMVIIEAFACGKPVIASNLGAMAELIEDGKTGLLFEPGNANDLAEKIIWACVHKKEMKQMGMNARKEYEEKYTAEKNYKMLIEIYEKAIKMQNSK